MDQTVIGISKTMFNEVCPKKFREKPFKCQNLDMQCALSYSECLGVKNYTFQYFYDNETINWDIFPFPSVFKPISHKDFSFFGTSVGFARHSYFTSSVSLYSDSPNIDWTFLIHPLRYQTWLLFAVLICFMFIVKSKIDNVLKNRRPSNFIRHVTLLFFGVIGLLTGVYTIKLDAIATVTAPKAPFTSTTQLASMVASGEKSIIRGGFLTDYIWDIISGNVTINGEYFESMKSLYNASRINVPLKIYDVLEICKMLHENPDLVYVTLEYEIWDNCPQYCFWNLEIEEVGAEIGAFIYNKNSTLKKDADVCVEFYRAYRNSILKRKTNFKNYCRVNRHYFKLIDWNILSPIFILLSFGLLFGVGCLIGEIVSKSFFIYLSHYTTGCKFLKWK